MTYRDARGPCAALPEVNVGDLVDDGSASAGAMAGLIEHPQGSYVLTSIVGFLLLFRSNLAYNRFWEGRTCALQCATLLRLPGLALAGWLAAPPLCLPALSGLALTPR